MNIRFSVFFKLLIFILPLVCLPVTLVGYLSIRASVDRVDRLVRREQMIQVNGAAAKINDAFYSCRIDLATLAGLPVLEEYHTTRSFRLKTEADFNRDNIVRLFKDFIERNPYYYQIRYISENGMELIKVSNGGVLGNHRDQRHEDFFTASRALSPHEIFTSDVVKTDFSDGHIVHWVWPIYSGWREFAGLIVIDFDFEKIIESVNKIQVGEKGYAFLVDAKGRNVAHPHFAPYTYSLDNYPDPSLKALVMGMMAGDVGWKSYFFNKEKKMAAFAFIPDMGWSLAVTIPVAEFTKEAQAIQTKVIQIMIITLIATFAGITILSYYLIRPVRNLVVATNRIAAGDLSQEIPVQSRDELGELTRSFNHMVKNLSRIQNELVRSEKLISLGRLSAGVAHEIRNPLNAMKGAIVHLQRRRAEDPLIKEYTQLFSEEIDRLNNFVTDFLYFAKQSKLEPVETDLNSLILSTRNLFQEQARSQNIRFHDHLAPHLPLLYVDPRQIEQVLINIVINAIDALPDGGDITFSSSLSNKNDDSPEMLEIVTMDNGVGIPEAHFQNIFDPFFSTKESGTGLGLPLSLGIVENHDGRMLILPREGQGTKVIIELPIKINPTMKNVGATHEKSTGG